METHFHCTYSRGQKLIIITKNKCYYENKKIKYKKITLKKLVIDYLLNSKFMNNLEKIKIPLDLIDEIKLYKKKCFDCNKIKSIYCKLYKIHEKFNIPCIYLYCWKCRKY